MAQWFKFGDNFRPRVNLDSLTHYYLGYTNGPHPNSPVVPSVMLCFVGGRDVDIAFENEAQRDELLEQIDRMLGLSKALPAPTPNPSPYPR